MEGRDELDGGRRDGNKEGDRRSLNLLDGVEEKITGKMNDRGRRVCL